MAYHDQLVANARDSRLAGVRDYFSSHGISYTMTLKYQLGYVVDPLPGDYRFTGMLAIPYITRHGVKALKFRRIGQQGAKYDQHVGQKHRLYNTTALQEADNIIGITEGEIDAIAATELLGLPSVGVPGANGWNSRLWRPLFRDFQTVVIFADGDNASNQFAGQDFAKQVAEDIGWRALIAQCPDGEDVSSMVAHGRADELKALYSTSNEENA